MDDTVLSTEDKVKEVELQRLSEIITRSIEKITQNVASLQRMVNQIGTLQDSPDLRKNLHSLQHSTQQLAKDTNGYIKDLNNKCRDSTHGKQLQWKIQRERLQEDFGTVLNMFQTGQRSTANKEREQVNKKKAQSIGDPFRGIPKKNQQLIELQDTSTPQLQLQDATDLKNLEEQEHSIRQLESDINDVNKIFKDLGALVHEQGETVDSIEANIESAADFVDQGAHQLFEASNYKNKVRKKKMIFISIALVILTIIILIIILQTSN